MQRQLGVEHSDIVSDKKAQKRFKRQISVKLFYSNAYDYSVIAAQTFGIDN